MIDCPRVFVISVAITRATTSEPPPAAYGTTHSIGWVGNAKAENGSAIAASAMNRRIAFSKIMRLSVTLFSINQAFVQARN
jgi:hypothetical protein